jgi:hypothetical protein
MPVGQNFSLQHLLGLPQDERPLSRLRPSLQSRARILSRRHVHQLRSGARAYFCLRCSSLGDNPLAFGEVAVWAVVLFLPFAPMLTFRSRVLWIYLDQTIDPEVK